MHRLNWLFGLVVIAFATGSLMHAQDTCDDEAPPQVRLLISKRFPGWRIKLPSDLEPYDNELWTKAHPKECPGIAVGRFEDPNRVAYGLLLIPKSVVETGYKIVVLAKPATADAYSVRVLDHAEGQPGTSSGLVISKVPPGKYTGFDTTQSVQLKLDGIEAEWIEKSSVLYFWTNGKYRTLQTSD